MATAKNEVVKTNLENLLPADLNSMEVIENVFEQLEQAEQAGSLQEVTSTYLNFDGIKEGTKMPFIFAGMTTVSDPEHPEVLKEAVDLLDRKGERFVTAATVIVNSLKKCTKVPCAVLLTYNGKTKGANGSYHSVNVKVLQP
jgi:hypothetical protein